ncbi:MAG: hypothetical protein NUW37_02680 [Planctomycetes bacterium]|nr:hypothetical protein [Planctomycetota bacterium]
MKYPPPINIFENSDPGHLYSLARSLASFYELHATSALNSAANAAGDSRGEFGRVSIAKLQNSDALQSIASFLRRDDPGSEDDEKSGGPGEARLKRILAFAEFFGLVFIERDDVYHAGVYHAGAHRAGGTFSITPICNWLAGGSNVGGSNVGGSNVGGSNVGGWAGNERIGNVRSAGNSGAGGLFASVQLMRWQTSDHTLLKGDLLGNPIIKPFCLVLEVLDNLERSENFLGYLSPDEFAHTLTQAKEGLPPSFIAKEIASSRRNEDSIEAAGENTAGSITSAGEKHRRVMELLAFSPFLSIRDMALVPSGEGYSPRRGCYLHLEGEAKLGQFFGSGQNDVKLARREMHRLLTLIGRTVFRPEFARPSNQGGMNPDASRDAEIHRMWFEYFGSVSDVFARKSDRGDAPLFSVHVSDTKRLGPNSYECPASIAEALPHGAIIQFFNTSEDIPVPVDSWLYQLVGKTPVSGLSEPSGDGSGDYTRMVRLHLEKFRVLYQGREN